MSLVIISTTLLFMGLRLPALGSSKSELVSNGFSPEFWHQPEEGDGYMKVLRSKELGRVHVFANIKDGKVDLFFIGCPGRRACARPPPSTMECVRVDQQSWRCTQDGADFDVHNCAGHAYILTMPGAEYPAAACSAMRPMPRPK